MGNKIVLFFSFCLAFCSFSYEVLIAGELTRLTSMDILSQSLTIGFYILSLGLGAMAFQWLDQKKQSALFLWTELALGLLGAGSILLIHVIYFLWPIWNGVNSIDMSSSKVSFILGAQVLTMILGFLSGLEIPFLSKMLDQRGQTFSFNWVLGFNYFGSLMAAILLPLSLLPALDVWGVSIVVGTINLLILVALIIYLKPRFVGVLSLSVLAALTLIMVLTAKYQIAESFFLRSFYFRVHPNSLSQQDIKNSIQVIEHLHPVQRIRTPYQTIDLVHDSYPVLDQSHHIENSFLVYLDTHFQFSRKHERIYHEIMAHVSIQSRDQVPRRVLLLGGGDGLLVRELLKYDEIESVTLVELDPEMIQLATTQPELVAMNRNSLHDPRVHIVMEDAMTYLMHDRNFFDAVFIDFPFPNNFDLVKLYSREFYQLVRKRTTPDGFMIFDYPVDTNNFNGITNRVIVSTLQAAGFPYQTIFGSNDPFILSTLKPINDFQAKQDWKNISDLSKKYLKYFALPDEQGLGNSLVNTLFRPVLLTIPKGGRN
ncbi:MAG: hypothetical protein COT73_03575 [Bdellovibrio sp. CG10_big_fil_rev_8_21_14_0_10_47_8]|nr:MAG: hypothetical protein COT73_03575 [Bdellovibrio sp. CG10_big_fil_rev_8_21_14_0_10_47_8]